MAPLIGSFENLRASTWYFVWELWDSLVSRALLVAVTVSPAAGVGVRSAAVPSPPLPGAGAAAASFSGGGARASPPAVTRARPAVERKRSENFSESHVFIINLNFARTTTNGQLHPHTGTIGSEVNRTQTFCALCYVIWS